VGVVAWICVVGMPGFGLASLVTPSLWRAPALLIAVSAPTGFAAAFVSSLVGQAIGFGPWPLLVGVGSVLFLSGLIRGYAHARSDGRGPLLAVTKSPEHRIAYGLLCLAILVGLVFWLVGGWPSVRPWPDTQNHGYFVSRIAFGNTVDPEWVFARSPTRPEQVTEFYPLGSHVTMAVGKRLTGTGIPELMITWQVLSAALILPCGVFALARQLYRRRPEVAGWAALVAAVTAIFPYQPAVWGGLSLTVGLSMVPAVVALCLRSVDRSVGSVIGYRESSEFSRRIDILGGLFLSAVAILGTSVVHTSQAVLLAVILAALALWDLGRVVFVRPPGSSLWERLRASTLLRWSALAALSAVLLLPTLTSTLDSATERSAYSEIIDDGPLRGVARLVVGANLWGPPQVISGLLAVAGLILLLTKRRNELGRIPALLLVMLAFTLVFISLVSGDLLEPLHTLAGPWYSTWWRVRYNLVVLTPLLAAPALEIARLWLSRRVPALTKPALSAGAVGLLLVALSAPTIVATLRTAEVWQDVVTQCDRTVYRSLQDSLRDRPRAAPVVLNQINDGTAWMYMLERLPAYSALDSSTEPGQVESDWLVNHAHELGFNAEVSALIDELGVSHVLTSEDVYYSGQSTQMPVDMYLDNPNYELLDSCDNLWLFAVVP
jgi:hypothetical protein